MSEKQQQAFQARRAQLLAKHAARDPDWERHQRARAPGFVRSVVAAMLGVGAMMIGLKGLALAHHGGDGYAALTAPLVAGRAPDGVLARVLAPDPASAAIADLLAPGMARSADHAQYNRTEPAGPSNASAGTNTGTDG